MNNSLDLVDKMAVNSTKAIFIVGAKRTPFCKYGGAMRELPASKAFASAAKDMMHSANVDPNIIDNTVVGNVFFLSQCDGGKNARYCGLYSGVAIETPALGINKSCGSGIQAIINSALDIKTGMSKVTLTGGTEIMSSLPRLVRNIRFGASLGQPLHFEDYIKKEFVDSRTEISLQRSAESIANRYGIIRDDMDKFAWDSYQKWKKAQEEGVFDEEVTPLTVQSKKKEISVKCDDVSDLCSVDDLIQLPTILEDGSLVTEGNSSRPADGAAALLISDESSCQLHNLKPLARISGWAAVGVGAESLGAAEAVKKMLDGSRVGIEDIDLFEINENFASETLAIIKDLAIDSDKVNKSGGALTLGNPTAATGARMVTHLVHQMRNGNVKRCVAASSCGGGQGVALMLEAP